jgi:hypothetical protein
MSLIGWYVVDPQASPLKIQEILESDKPPASFLLPKGKETTTLVISGEMRSQTLKVSYYSRPEW